MKVNIGNYYSYRPLHSFLSKWLPYDWAECLDQYFGWDRHNFTRKAVVRIDPYDLYSLDNTLAIVISEALKKYRREKSGVPYVDNEDVPESLRDHRYPFSTKDEKIEAMLEIDDSCYARWYYVLDEMQFAFDAIRKEEELDHEDRVNNGLRLFGKYYRALWT